MRATGLFASRTAQPCEKGISPGEEIGEEAGYNRPQGFAPGVSSRFLPEQISGKPAGRDAGDRPTVHGCLHAPSSVGKADSAIVGLQTFASLMHNCAMIVRRATKDDTDAWSGMRAALWPDGSVNEHRMEVVALIESGFDKSAAFVALDENGCAIGFAEAALRHDYVNGCDTSPVAFLEGIYVSPGYQGKDVGRKLALAVRGWAREQGCTELASDALIDNHASHAFHAAIGFVETERVVYFRQAL